MDISGFGKICIVIGAVLILIGVVFMFAQKIPFIGRLPGDIYVKKENFSFYFPLATSILLSVILSIILIFLGKRR